MAPSFGAGDGRNHHNPKNRSRHFRRQENLKSSSLRILVIRFFHFVADLSLLFQKCLVVFDLEMSSTFLLQCSVIRIWVVFINRIPSFSPVRRKFYDTIQGVHKIPLNLET